MTNDQVRGLRDANTRRQRRAGEMDAVIAAAILATSITRHPVIRLTTLDRRILLRRASQPDLSWQDIATILGITKSAAAGRFRRRKNEWLAAQEDQ